MTQYYRPLVQPGSARSSGAMPLTGGPLWFSHAEMLERAGPPRVVEARDIPEPALTALTAPRAPVTGLTLDRPRIMGIVNVTPDSFSDGGVHFETDTAIGSALAMVEAGADIIDIGGESTRPGAATVSENEEIDRIAPVIAGIRARSGVPISIDTRKAPVARAAVDAGATLVNDVSGFTYDPDLARYCADRGLPVCVMHAQGDPATMQKNPRYDNVVLDIHDFLQTRIDALAALGIAPANILVDPGIGFGKTRDHNLTILQNISLFHGLGCAILLGASRKRFIGTVADEPVAERRVSGSIAVGLAALGQGVQILRVHDVRETVQAVRLWLAVR